MARRKVSFLITAKNKGFLKAIDQSARRMKRFGRKMERTGRTMTQNITMPVAAAGGAAVKMASDFESSLARAQAQADLTAKQVSFIGDSAKETAKRTGESTDDIIEAYKFTISAGKDLAEAQEIVGAAAEASAAGFGEQRDLVRTATTAMEAYSGRLDSGRQFMDLLVGSAQQMELEVDKLSGAMQRNVGIANELGVGMEELLVGIGATSEIMGDAQRGGRLFQTMLTKLLRPTEGAKKAIEGVFGSVTNLHKSIREDGLLRSMVTLRKELEANSEEGLGLVFAQRDLEAALNFTNREGARSIEILKNMGDTAGSTRSAFDDVSDTTERRFKRALQNVKVAAIEFGEIMLPVANKVITAVKNIAESFTNMSTESRTQILKIAGMLAVSGPLAIAIGKMAKLVVGFSKLVRSKFFLITATIALLATTAQWVYDNWNISFTSMEDTLKRFANGVKTLFGVVGEAAVFLAEKIAQMLQVVTRWAVGAGKSLLGFGQQAKENAKFVEALFGDTFGFMSHMIDQQEGQWVSFGESAKNVFRNLSDVIDQTMGSLIEGTSLEDFLALFEDGGPGGDGGQSGGIESPIGAASLSAIGDFAKKYIKNIGDMKVAISEYRSITEAALERVAQKARVTGQVFEQTLTNAITGFAETMGKVFSGDAGAKSFFQGILMIAVDFANKFGKLLVAAGVAAQAFESLLANPVAAIIAGSSLIALTTAIRGLLEDGPNKSRSVNDALIRSDGSVVNLHPDDDILAMKDFGNLQGSFSERSMTRAMTKALQGANWRIRGTDLVLAVGRGKGLLNR